MKKDYRHNKSNLIGNKEETHNIKIKNPGHDRTLLLVLEAKKPLLSKAKSRMQIEHFPKQFCKLFIKKYPLSNSFYWSVRFHLHLVSN